MFFEKKFMSHNFKFKDIDTRAFVFVHDLGTCAGCLLKKFNE